MLPVFGEGETSSCGKKIRKEVPNLGRDSTLIAPDLAQTGQQLTADFR
jgi:hypothetical protein